MRNVERRSTWVVQQRRTPTCCRHPYARPCSCWVSADWGRRVDFMLTVFDSVVHVTGTSASANEVHHKYTACNAW